MVRPRASEPNQWTLAVAAVGRVIAEFEHEPTMTGLVRGLPAPLLPHWDDKNFADAYMHAVTSTLLEGQNERTDEIRDRPGQRQ